MKKILSKTLLTIKATALITVFTLTHQKSFAARPEICTKPVPNPKTIHELYSCKRLLRYLGNTPYMALSKDYIKKNIIKEEEYKIPLQNGKHIKTYTMKETYIKGFTDGTGKMVNFIPAFIIRHKKNQKYIQENIIFNGVASNFGETVGSNFMSKAEVLKFLQFSKHDLVVFKALANKSHEYYLADMITNEEQYKTSLKEAQYSQMVFK